jgi:predicted NBD/HSP70 family sugar kinase
MYLVIDIGGTFAKFALMDQEGHITSKGKRPTPRTNCAQPILLERIQWAIDEIKKANPQHMANPKVVACHFQNDANLYGALYHFLNQSQSK